MMFIVRYISQELLMTKLSRAVCVVFGCLYLANALKNTSFQLLIVDTINGYNLATPSSG